MRRTIFSMSMCLVYVVMAGFTVFAFAPPQEKESAGKQKEAKGTKEPGTSQESKTSSKESKSAALAKSKKMKSEPIYNQLDSAEKRVILGKGTEPAFVGKLTNNKAEGTYICRRCNAPLYNSTDKFESHCGWPSFDDEIKEAVHRQIETDGTGRIEIVCKNCGGHLGHVFSGEGMTKKNTRHCVNSISMKFVAKGKDLPPVIGRDSDDESPAEGTEVKEKETGKEKPKEIEKSKSLETGKPGKETSIK